MGKVAAALLDKRLQEKFLFYHLVPKKADIDALGLVSPEYALAELNDEKLFHKMTDKYRDRLTRAWGIYPGRNPESLTDEEIISGLEKVRGKGGANRIYFFKYAPTKTLGPNMTKVLKNKDIYELDLNNPEVKKLIKKIDWGREGSSPSGKKLSEQYYKQVSLEDYVTAYNDNQNPLFAGLNHISVEPINGYIPKKYLKKK